MVTFATTHNGGKSQIQMNFLQFGGDFPFLNHYKNSSDFGWNDNSGRPDAQDVDDNGYVTTTAHTGWGRLFFIPRQSDRPGNYVLKWSGIGTLGGPWNRTVVSGSFTNTVEGAGRVVVTPGTNRISLIVSTFTVTITNIVFCHVDDEAALDAGGIFGVKFKQRLVEANVGSIRFMDWQVNNQNGMGTWAHRRLESYATWTSVDCRSSVAGADATQSGLTITVPSTYSGFTGANRQMLTFRMPATITGSNTNGAQQFLLAPAGGPTKPIHWLGGHSKTNLIPDEPTHAFYVSELDCYVIQPYGLNNGAPYEVCLKLCAEIGAHPYFNMPAWCGNAPEDTNHWGYGLATLVKNFKAANGCGWMCEKIEGPNECWNFAGGFTTVFVAWTTQHRLNGGAAYPADPNNLVVGDWFDVTAFAYPSATAGAGYCDVTVSQSIPLVVIGSNLTLSNMDANGTSGADFRSVYVTAINVGGNPKKITGKISNAVGGTYDGSGGTIYPNQYDNGNFYGRVMGRMMKRWHAAYGDGGSGRDTKYQFLIGVQTMYANGLNLGAQGERFLSPHWALVNGTGERACDLATHCATTNYFNPGDQYKIGEHRKAFTQYVTQKGNATLQAATVAAYVDSFPFDAYKVVHNNWKEGLLPLGLHLTNYEGGWSPDYSQEYFIWTAPWSNGPMSVVTGATKAAQCVVTLPRSTSHNQFPSGATSISAGDAYWVYDGQPYVAGQQLNFFYVSGMTELNQGGPATTRAADGTWPGGLSFTSGSDQIGWAPTGGGGAYTNTLPFVGQSVSVDCQGAPWPFGTTLEKGGLYWVVARNVSPAWIKISATKGGASIVIPTAPTFEDVVMQAGWRVVNVNDSTNAVTLDCNSTSFGTWTATPTDVFLQRAVADRGDKIINVLRGKSKTCFDSPLKPGKGLQGWLEATYVFHTTELSQTGFRSEFPSCFDLSTERASEAYAEHDGQIWGVLVNIFESPDPPQWKAIKAFNVTSTGAYIRYNMG